MNGSNNNLTNKFCNKPFDNFEVHYDWKKQNGKVTMCCSRWLSTPIGSVSKDYDVDQTFNSEQAKLIRESILDGSYKYCNKELCPLIQNGSLPDKDTITDERYRNIIDNHVTDGLSPTFYNMSYDVSCNLTCPSCRYKKYSHTSGPVYDKLKDIQDQIVKDVFTVPHDRYCLVSITGSGDPFGSKLFRNMLFNIDGALFPNVYINLQTNGVLFTERYWNKMSRIQKNINTVIVSIDAGTEETYKIVRRGGHWKQLNKNLAMLGKLRANNEIAELRLDNCIQKHNYKEMPLMVELGVKANADTVYFSKVIDWGNYWDGGDENIGNNKFQDHNITSIDHPEHKQFLDVINQPIMGHKIVDLGNISSYRV